VKPPRRKFLHLAAGAAALPAVSRIAWAQDWKRFPSGRLHTEAASIFGWTVVRGDFYDEDEICRAYYPEVERLAVSRMRNVRRSQRGRVPGAPHV
jgi:hypothetical protein